MSKLMGMLSHRKLMELKNSGAVVPTLLEDLADNLYRGAMAKVKEALLKENKGFNWERLWFYGDRMAHKDAYVMFSDRTHLTEHLRATNCHSRFIPLTQEEAEELLFVDRAVRAVEVCKEVLECFKYHNEVLADSDTGYYVHWVLQNSVRIQEVVNKTRDF